MVDTIHAPLIETDSMARFLLDLKERIEYWDHTLQGEVEAIEIVDKEGREKEIRTWVKKHPKIMEDETRIKFINILQQRTSRTYLMSYYPEYNDVMHRCRMFMADMGDFLTVEYHNENIHCSIEYLVLLLSEVSSMIEACLLWALQGGMRQSLRQTMRTVESIKTGDRPREKKFKWF